MAPSPSGSTFSDDMAITEALHADRQLIGCRVTAPFSRKPNRRTGSWRRSKRSCGGKIAPHMFDRLLSHLVH